LNDAEYDHATTGVEFHRRPEGIEVVDTVEQTSITAQTDTEPNLSRRDSATIQYPVDAVIEIDGINEMSFELSNLVFVRDAGGNDVVTLGTGEKVTLGEGVHVLDTELPIKTYVRVTGRVTVARDGGLVIDLGETDRVLLGARSPHQRPVETITTTDDPRDIMMPSPVCRRHSRRRVRNGRGLASEGIPQR
jgi:hypothetical protein